MSVYPPPIQINSIFNPYNYSSLDSALTIRQANKTYLIKTGADTDIGPLTLSNPLKLPNGSVSSPAIQFVNSSNTGFYAPSSNVIGITTSGVQRITIGDTLFASSIPLQATTFQATSGTYPECAYTNSTNTQTGLYFGTTTTCAIACNGSTKMTFGTSANTSFNNITVPDGTVVSPSVNFSSNTNSGIYRQGLNSMGFSQNGTESFRVSASGNFSVNSNGMRTIDGSSSIAGYNFSSEQNSGMFKNAAGDIRFTAGGTVGMGVQANGIFLYGSTAGNNASYSASKLGYYEETGLITGTWTFGGANTQTGTVYITRIGRIVNLQFTGDVVRASSGSISQITSDTFIPLRFRPVSARQIAVVMIGDGTSLSFWYANIGGDGSLSFVKILSAGVTGTHTIYASSLTWSIT